MSDRPTDPRSLAERMRIVSTRLESTGESEDADTVAEAIRALASADPPVTREPDGWQPIETAPLNEWVLTWDGRVTFGRTNGKHGWWEDGADEGFSPTHWMRVPGPPSAGGSTGPEPLFRCCAACGMADRHTPDCPTPNIELPMKAAGGEQPHTAGPLGYDYYSPSLEQPRTVTRKQVALKRILAHAGQYKVASKTGVRLLLQSIHEEAEAALATTPEGSPVEAPERDDDAMTQAAEIIAVECFRSPDDDSRCERAAAKVWELYNRAAPSPPARPTREQVAALRRGLPFDAATQVHNAAIDDVLRLFAPERASEGEASTSTREDR